VPINHGQNRIVDMLCIVRTEYTDFTGKLSYQETGKRAKINVVSSQVPSHGFSISKNMVNLLMAFNSIKTDSEMLRFLKRFDLFSDIRKPSQSTYDNCNDSVQCYGAGTCKVFLNQKYCDCIPDHLGSNCEFTTESFNKIRELMDDSFNNVIKYKVAS